MKIQLRSKASFGDGVEVAAVWQNIEAYVSADEAERAVEIAAREVRSLASPDRSVYGWSGGKDSLALQVVMERAGIRHSVAGIIPELEFQGYLEWLGDNAPLGMVSYMNTALDLEWLAENQQHLFPASGKEGYFWTLASARFAQRRYQEDHHPELQIFGRRKQDGNNCGKSGITREKELVSYNPLRDWPHELVLGVIHHKGLTLPPIYEHGLGWGHGTGCWPGLHRRRSLDEAWAFVHEVEPERVIAAAELIDSADSFLRSVSAPGRI